MQEAGRNELEIRDQIRGQAEAAAVDTLGASPPWKEEDRSVFGNKFGAGEWKVLCKTGAISLGVFIFILTDFAFKIDFAPNSY